MDRKRFFLSVAGFLILMSLITLPGILSTQIIAHEMYHIYKNQDSAKSFCVDINNPPYIAHVQVLFPDHDAMRTYIEQSKNGEEAAAMRAGYIVSAIYVMFSVLAVLWVSWIVTCTIKPQRIRRHVIRHVRRIRRYIRRKRRR